MFKRFEEIKNYVEKNNIKMIDIKIIDINGRWKHLTIPVERFGIDMFEKGFGFDGSNYGYSAVENSDMVVIPDMTTGFYDPFWEEPTLSFIGSIFEILEKGFKPFGRDPRSILKNAIACMKEQGIGDTFIVGPEFEYYVFDGIQFMNKQDESRFKITADQSSWSSNNEGSLGYNLLSNKGYHADAPYDRNRDLRSAICMALAQNGVEVKYHHQEVGGPGQQEIEFALGNAIKLADDCMLGKYFIKNMAFQRGKTATFMPKPMYGEAGNGFHVHMQVQKEGKTVFADDEGYCGLSETALHFMGGILKHAAALTAISAPSTNSFKRLVKGYEAPISICYGSSNRSAVIRIPSYAKSPESRRFEFRVPDAMGNVYLTFASLIMAGIDGVINKIDPEKGGYGPVGKNIYDLVDSGQIKLLPTHLDEALVALDQDRDFLRKNNVFDDVFIQSWIDVKGKEAHAVNITPSPKEFELYYDL